MTNISDLPTFPRRFALGAVVATPGALEALDRAGLAPAIFLARHECGDWGDLSEDDRAENEFALGKRIRIFSAPSWYAARNNTTTPVSTNIPSCRAALTGSMLKSDSMM